MEEYGYEIGREYITDLLMRDEEHPMDRSGPARPPGPARASNPVGRGRDSDVVVFKLLLAC
jgi:hypothetical protein